ncbi:MAG: VOC family protein [Dehalococcoidia bacterium]|nr:VOC family protein [Dehalococcoidia bacterium]
MPVHLDHTIVPARDKEASARWFAEVMGLEYQGPWGHFAPVRIDEYLSLDFDNSDSFQTSHYAFIVTDTEFDDILGRVQLKRIVYGSRPFASEDMQINHAHQGRGFYFKDPNGHLLEVITHTYV